MRKERIFFLRWELHEKRKERILLIEKILFLILFPITLVFSDNQTFFIFEKWVCGKFFDEIDFILFIAHQRYSSPSCGGNNLVSQLSVLSETCYPTGMNNYISYSCDPNFGIKKSCCSDPFCSLDCSNTTLAYEFEAGLCLQLVSGSYGIFSCSPNHAVTPTLVSFYQLNTYYFNQECFGNVTVINRNTLDICTSNELSYMEYSCSSQIPLLNYFSDKTCSQFLHNNDTRILVDSTCHLDPNFGFSQNGYCHLSLPPPPPTIVPATTATSSSEHQALFSFILFLLCFVSLNLLKM